MNFNLPQQLAKIPSQWWRTFYRPSA